MNLDPNGFIWKEAKGAWTFYGLDWRCINWDRIDGIIHDAMLWLLDGLEWEIMDWYTHFFFFTQRRVSWWYDGWMDGWMYMDESMGMEFSLSTLPYFYFIFLCQVMIAHDGLGNGRHHYWGIEMQRERYAERASLKRIMLHFTWD